jgi:F0F1-type ATP synthase delta subunit
MAAFVSRYASAFLDVVTSAKAGHGRDRPAVADFLATWDGSPELREFFVNPSIPAVQKVGILDKLNAKLGLQKELRNLLAVLIDNDRIGQVSEVAAAYRKLLQEQLGIRQAEIVTARELGAKGTRRAGGGDRQTGRRAHRSQLQAGPSPSWAARWCASAPRFTTAPCADGWTG